MGTRFIYLLSFVMFVALHSQAAGQDETSPTRRPAIGLLASLSMHNGAALGARFGLGYVGIDLMAGYQLLYATYDVGERSKVDLGSSAQLVADAYFMPWRPLDWSAIGLKFGYRYNTVLHNGWGLALAILVSFSNSLSLEVTGGGQYFPDSKRRLRDRVGTPQDVAIDRNSSVQLFEYGAQLIWYPWD